MKTMKTRFVGQCPVCEGDFKLRDGRLVHHGFERPGDGMIHGDCFAVGYEPYEVSCESSKLYRAKVEALKASEVEYLSKLQNGTIVELYVEKRVTFTGRGGGVVKVEKATDPDQFANVLRSKIWETDARISSADREIARMTKLIDAWTLKPVRTFEEEAVKAQADKQARKDVKEAARQEKIAKKVAFYQKRIDSAFSKKKADSLRDLYDSVLRASSDLKLTRQEMLDLVDRKNVWDLFGLVTPSSWKDDVNFEALKKMWVGGYWPTSC